MARGQGSRWLQAQKQADPSFPANQTLVKGDSRYSPPDFIYSLVMKAETNGRVWLRGNRIVFGPPLQASSRRGHPR